MFLDFSNLKMRYEPFPVGVARPATEDATYQRFVDAFPRIDLFDDYEYLGKPGAKLTLSEKENPKKYRDFVSRTSPWNDFHKWIKSDPFVYGIVDLLKAHYIDLGIKRMSPFRHTLKMIRHGRLDSYVRNPKLTSRFEFSILRGDGGHLPPHTDAPSKVITIIVSMAPANGWNPAYGGGTVINRAKSDRWRFNYMNKTAAFEDMDVVEVFPFVPNQAILFVKTHNSWHSVEPIRAGNPDVLRRTLTINIEKF